MTSTATSYEPLTRRDPFSVSTIHANGHASDPDSPPSTPSASHSPQADFAGISLRAFLLGLTFASAVSVTLLLALLGNPLWRLPFFLAALSLFHWLEYQVTALYNPTVATVSAFLLSQNGKAYNTAHGLAFLECLVRYTILKPLIINVEALISAHTPEPNQGSGTDLFRSFRHFWLALGFAMLVFGQVIRTIAMAKAGSNFNHTVQMRKKQGHVLVTDGIYLWLRHPSYFGFFWWGLGTQVVLGNPVCLTGYLVVLWRFFRHRIREEEILLVKFFGDEYVDYRQRTWSGLPFIR